MMIRKSIFWLTAAILGLYITSMPIVAVNKCIVFSQGEGSYTLSDKVQGENPVMDGTKIKARLLLTQPIVTLTKGWKKTNSIMTISCTGQDLSAASRVGKISQIIRDQMDDIKGSVRSKATTFIDKPDHAVLMIYGDLLDNGELARRVTHGIKDMYTLSLNPKNVRILENDSPKSDDYDMTHENMQKYAFSPTESPATPVNEGFAAVHICGLYLRNFFTNQWGRENQEKYPVVMLVHRDNAQISTDETNKRRTRLWNVDYSTVNIRFANYSIEARAKLEWVEQKWAVITNATAADCVTFEKPGVINDIVINVKNDSDVNAFKWSNVNGNVVTVKVNGISIPYGTTLELKAGVSYRIELTLSQVPAH